MTTIEAIVSHFLNYHDVYESNDVTTSDKIIAQLIDGNDYHLLTRNHFMTVIQDQLISPNQALQLLIHTLGNSEYKICAKIKWEFGRYIKRYYKKDKTKINLTANNLCKDLEVLSEKIVASLHRNTNFRIKQCEMLFVIDKDRKLWFMGTESCVVTETPMSLHKNSTERSLAFITGLPRNSSTNSIRSKSVQRRQCQGDFCNVNLKASYDHEDPEVNYDEIVNHI